MELIILWLIAIFVFTYRKNTGDNFYKFLMSEINNVYEKYAPYSYQMVREKTKELGITYFNLGNINDGGNWKITIANG